VSGRYPDHRVQVAVNLQTWEHLTFLHWPYDATAIQRLVPDSLRVQEWDGVTWVGITPFRMVQVRAPGLRAPPGWDEFPELNVRTYVRSADGRDGIWFLTMLVPRLSFLAALRSIGLPYVLSDSEVGVAGRRWDYRFGEPQPVRPPADDWFSAQVQVGEALTEADRTELVDSLTGRWNAFHRRAGVLWRTPVTHEPWPLHQATVTGRLTAPLRLAGLAEPEGPPMVHAAPVVHSRLGSLRPA
jgi:hypothetical protein